MKKSLDQEIVDLQQKIQELRERQRESKETKEPLLPTFLKQSEYNPFTSSSEEEEFDINEKLFRNKPKPKTEKHKCRLVIALGPTSPVIPGLGCCPLIVKNISFNLSPQSQQQHGNWTGPSSVLWPRISLSPGDHPHH